MRSQQLTPLLLLLFLLSGGCVSDITLVGDRSSSLEWHPRFHTAQRGDTLYSIAWSYGQDYRLVAKWNGISSPYVIRPGQRIRIAPPPEFGKQRRSAGKIPSTPGATVSATPPPEVKAYPLPRVKAPLPSGKPLPVPDTAPVKLSPKNADKEIDWQWPTSGKLIPVASGSGQKRPGINIQGRRGQAIYAAAPGKVVYSGSGLIGYGKLIILKHNNQYLSAYAHNWELLVREGEQVAKGVQIAKMGSSGAERVMLHFEIRHNGKPVDPLRYLPKR